jgi:hypothetical protein
MTLNKIPFSLHCGMKTEVGRVRNNRFVFILKAVLSEIKEWESVIKSNSLEEIRSHRVMSSEERVHSLLIWGTEIKQPSQNLSLSSHSYTIEMACAQSLKSAAVNCSIDHSRSLLPGLVVSDS